MLSWFFVPFKRDTTREAATGRITRYPAIFDFNAQIEADGGKVSQPLECLGNYAVVKVNASAATLQAINAAPGIVRVPIGALDNTLDTLTLAQRQQLRTFLGNLGYTAGEIQAKFGGGADLSGFTVGDVLRFALTRRLRPRYDQATDTVILDGPQDLITPVEVADVQVS